MSIEPEDREVLDVLGRLDAIEPPGDLPRRFQARLAVTRIRTPIARWWPTLVAASLALLLGAGWFVERRARHSEVATLKVELEAAMSDLSAAKRLVAVNATRSAGLPDAELVATLTQVMLTDESPSVRIAAIEAIAEFGSRSQLASAVNQGLSREPSALVQTALLGAAERLDAAERSRSVAGFLTRAGLDPIVARDARTLLAL